MEFNNMIRYSITFGRGLKSGGSVTLGAVDAFIAGEVAPRFQGFSVRHESGYWNGVPESAFTVSIACKVNEKNIDKVEGIARAWNSRFDQDCVLITREVIEVAFNDER